MASNPTAPGATPPGSVPPGEQPNVTSVPNTMWNNNAHLPDPQAVNSRHPYTPAKPAGAGDRWKHVRYHPAWTDPDWHDEGKERDKTDFKIANFFDRLRPALLPKDQYKQPTKYAHRFSIFPGRLDGRSRASPTRADSRKLFPANGDVKTGQELFDRFEKMAAIHGQDVDEFMDEARLDMQQGTEIEQQYMQQYEDLLIDENWQTILFGNLTMDEVHAEEYLTMEDFWFEGLSGPLYRLFERDMWADTTQFGADKMTPRFVYSLDGVREEWDPRTNDRVWDAMQPALQLASRFMVADHPFIAGIQDITNRYKVPDYLYKHMANQDPKDFKLKIKPNPMPFDPDLFPGARQLQSCTRFSPRAATWQVLEKVLVLELGSGFYCSGLYSEHSIGRTDFPGLLLPDRKISVTVDAELVWIMMSDKYSKSEKMLASLVFASTLAHEMIHAWSCAPAKWICNPVAFGITGPVEFQACAQLWQDLCPKDMWPYEPYYDNDPENEVGHAFESHVLGGGYWPFINTNMGYVWPRLMHGSTSIIARSMWPNGGWNRAPNLIQPHIRFEKLNHFVRVADVRRFFSQSFWDIAIAKYGTAALREPSGRPHKLSYNPANVALSTSMWDHANVRAKPGDRKWIQNFINKLLDRGHNALNAYFTALVTDALDFGSMLWRFNHESQGWDERDAKWAEFQQEALMLIYEYTGFTIMLNAGQNPAATLAPDKISALTGLYREWDAARRRLGRCPDDESNVCAGMGPDFWRTQMLAITIDRYEGRLIARLMDLTNILGDECAWQESMICELYQLPTSFWSIYRDRARDHARRLTIRANKIVSALGDLIQAMAAAEFDMPAWTTEWEVRITELGARFQIIGRLMALDLNNYEAGWSDMLKSMPRLRTSCWKRHQVWFFLAKKEMLSMEGKVLEQVREFKTRFEKMVKLGGSKIILPELDQDELAIAQRLARTLDDGSDNNPITKPSTGFFDVPEVKDIANRLAQEDQQAKDDKLKRAKGDGDGDGQSPTLQQAAASQANQAPSIPPKVQQMGMGNQTTSFVFPQKPAPGTGFAVYSSAANSPFPSQTPGAPSAWVAGNSANLAQLVNQPVGATATLGGAPATSLPGYGILPHPYAIRETISSDLFNTAQMTLLQNDPSTFAQHPPREWGTTQDSGQGGGPLGDVGQMWEQQWAMSSISGSQHASQDSDIEMVDANRARTFIVDISGDDDDRAERESSETTSVESWDEDEYEAGSKAAGSKPFKNLKQVRSLKRKASWMVPNPRQPWLTRGRMEKKRRGQNSGQFLTRSQQWW